MSSIAMSNAPVCQSCGLPLDSPGLFGTDARGEPVRNYCVYCYHRGAFTEPQISREAMIERVADLLMKEEHLAHMQARDVADDMVPRLERWKQDSARA
jgi:hypothetical protein